jgi:hypothetical protein
MGCRMSTAVIKSVAQEVAPAKPRSMMSINVHARIVPVGEQADSKQSAISEMFGI